LRHDGEELGVHHLALEDDTFTAVYAVKLENIFGPMPWVSIAIAALPLIAGSRPAGGREGEPSS